jgi:hypothetical protein
MLLLHCVAKSFPIALRSSFSGQWAKRWESEPTKQRPLPSLPAASQNHSSISTIAIGVVVEHSERRDYASRGARILVGTIRQLSTPTLGSLLPAPVLSPILGLAPARRLVCTVVYEVVRHMLSDVFCRTPKCERPALK